MMGLTPKSHFAIALFSILGKCCCWLAHLRIRRLLCLDRCSSADDSDWFSWLFVPLQANWVHAVRIVISIIVIVLLCSFHIGRVLRIDWEIVTDHFLWASFHHLQDQAIQAHAIPCACCFRLYYFWSLQFYKMWRFVDGWIVWTFQRDLVS